MPPISFPLLDEQLETDAVALVALLDVGWSLFVRLVEQERYELPLVSGVVSTGSCNGMSVKLRRKKLKCVLFLM